MEQFIEYVCSDLDISIPKISFDISFFATSTTLAAVVPEENIIYIREEKTLDTYFAIAHELRHLWQYKKHKHWLDNYKTSKEVSIEEYNLQFVEVDANAYALVVIDELFNVYPTFNGLSDKVIESIEKRADEICG